MFRKIFAVSAAFLLLLAFGCSDKGKNRGTDSFSDDSESVALPVTRVTEVTEITYVTVTDDEGQTVTDSQGKALTTAQTVVVTVVQTMPPADATQTSDEARGTAAVTTAVTAITRPTTTPRRVTTSAATTRALATTTAKTAVTGESNPSYSYGKIVYVDAQPNASDGCIAALTFDVLEGAKGLYEVNISHSAFSQITYDSEMEIVDVDFIMGNAFISVGSGIQTDVPAGSSPAVYIDSAESDAGSSVTVYVRVKNSVPIGSCELIIQYDGNGLKLSKIEPAELTMGRMMRYNTDYTLKDGEKGN